MRRACTCFMLARMCTYSCTARPCAHCIHTVCCVSLVSFEQTLFQCPSPASRSTCKEHLTSTQLQNDAEDAATAEPPGLMCSRHSDVEPTFQPPPAAPPQLLPRTLRTHRVTAVVTQWLKSRPRLRSRAKGWGHCRPSKSWWTSCARPASLSRAGTRQRWQAYHCGSHRWTCPSLVCAWLLRPS